MRLQRMAINWSSGSLHPNGSKTLPYTLMVALDLYNLACYCTKYVGLSARRDFFKLLLPLLLSLKVLPLSLLWLLLEALPSV